jgi:ABC-type cobalamin/Fe3+-siderophores transport system ATPase subunit
MPKKIINKEEPPAAHGPTSLDEITVLSQENSSVGKEIPIKLSNYTIFAGENNSGKTNLIKALIAKIGIDKVIYIPAERINALAEVKTTAKEDPMRDAISKLLSIVLSSEPTISGGFSVLFKNIETTFRSFSVLKTDLKLDPKVFEKSELEKILKDSIAARILDYSVLDKYYGKNMKITLDSVGQGIQRLIITAIIQEIGKIRTAGPQLVILFEEPEIYLHPKLKEKLHDSLVSLSSQPNIKVVLTTHDPYFIELASDKRIYHVLRDKDGFTYVEEVKGKSLPKDWRSFNEINYLVFGVGGLDYLNELYGFLESELGDWIDVDNELAKKEVQDKQRQKLGDKKMTMTSYIRHEIHHKTNETKYEPKDIDVGIENLRTIISEKGLV